MEGMKAQDYLKEIVEALAIFGIGKGLFFHACDGTPVVCSDINGLFGLFRDNEN